MNFILSANLNKFFISYYPDSAYSNFVCKSTVNYVSRIQLNKTKLNFVSDYWIAQNVFRRFSIIEDSHDDTKYFVPLRIKLW